MIDILTVPPKKAKPNYPKYPYLGEYHYPDDETDKKKKHHQIVLFTRERTGVVLKDSKYPNQLGCASSNFYEDQFEVYDSGITIMNRC